MKFGDILILVLASLLLAHLYQFYWFDEQSGHLAKIRTPYETFEISLLRNQEIEVKGSLGPSRVQVDAGRIRFIRSPCPGKNCIHSGWLTSGGQFAACLPNGISILVQAGGADYDSINF